MILKVKNAAFDPNAGLNFECTAESNKNPSHSVIGKIRSKILFQRFISIVISFQKEILIFLQ